MIGLIMCASLLLLQRHRTPVLMTNAHYNDIILRLPASSNRLVMTQLRPLSGEREGGKKKKSKTMISTEPCTQPQGQPDADTPLQCLTCEDWLTLPPPQTDSQIQHVTLHWHLFPAVSVSVTKSTRVSRDWPEADRCSLYVMTVRTLCPSEEFK